MIKQNEIKYQACNLCESLLGNVNDNFVSVSFDFLRDGDIQVKIILEKRTEVEDVYIVDLIAEFASMQDQDCIRPPEIEVGLNELPLRNLVYQKRIS